jgi:DNA-binding MarR family transcriptional regulator
MINCAHYRCGINLFAGEDGSMCGRARLYDQIKESFLLLDFGDRQFLEAFGLTVPRYYALVHIAAEPGLSPSSLSKRMFCDKSNITRLLQSLEAEGYVARQPHEQDRRLHRLFLTPRGEQVQGEIRTAHEAYIDCRLNVLSPSLVEEMARILHQLNRQLDRDLGRSPAAVVN